MRLSGLLFDFDGTLVDTLDSVCLEHKRVALSLGLEPVPKKMFAMRGNMGWPEFISTHLPDADVGEYLSRYKIENEKAIPLPGVGEVLEILHEQYKLGIVSGRRKEAILHHLNLLGLGDSIFDVIIGRDDVGRQKPDPECLIKAAETLGLQAPQVAYIGDTLIDLETAQSAGTTFIGVLTGETTKDEFHKAGADNVIENIKELPRILEKINP